MPVRNLHQKPFDEGTRDKLELYREYLREWLPVFINGSSVDILPANKEGTFYTPYVKHFFQEINICKIDWLYTLS